MWKCVKHVRPKSCLGSYVIIIFVMYKAAPNKDENQKNLAYAFEGESDSSDDDEEQRTSAAGRIYCAESFVS